MKRPVNIKIYMNNLGTDYACVLRTIDFKTIS